MWYHLILTEECNSQCRYCYEKSFKEFDNGLEKKFKFDFSEEKKEIDIEKLKNFLSKDKNPVVIFYGGEPLLRIDLIKKITENINVPFRIQTNGKLLDKIPINYLKKIEKILVSIDGEKERTDFNRGKGTFNLVMKNLNKIKKKGYKGEIIARMTISTDFPDIDRQVLFLYKSGFSSIHWQLDVGFYKFDYEKEKIEKFFEEYNKNIRKLLEFWVAQIEKGKVLKFYPFLGIAESFLKKEKTELRCGAGHSGYAITLDGKIYACPIMNCIKDFEAGNLDSQPKKLKKFSCQEECSDCSYYDFCGGRCLYWRKAKLWPEEGDKMICDSVKFLIEKIKKQLPRIEKAIKTKKLSLNDFDYEKYFGPEIIP
ncbi:MAG: TIGR04084 family radical SAM/SPASM domain-containing protein [Candidatus Pacearchaeota archaeon]